MIVGTYGEITKAITRDYATITPLGGRDYKIFVPLPYPSGDIQGEISGNSYLGGLGLKRNEEQW